MPRAEDTLRKVRALLQKDIGYQAAVRGGAQSFVDSVAIGAAWDIYARYYERYDGEVQGCCPLIADEVQRKIGGEVVAGYLTWHGGCSRRSHWWVERNGVTFDSMGDHFLMVEMGPGREEAHRDRAIFLAILPHYEQWRL